MLNLSILSGSDRLRDGLFTTAIWKPQERWRRVVAMRGVPLALLAVFLAAPAFGQAAMAKVPAVRTSVCEIVKHPERFEGQSVTVHARYSVNWEWGAWIGEERCEKALGLSLANGYPTPAYLSNLYVEMDSAFDLNLTRDECSHTE
jgi:hypothetical protein